MQELCAANFSMIHSKGEALGYLPEREEVSSWFVTGERFAGVIFNISSIYSCFTNIIIMILYCINNVIAIVSHWLLFTCLVLI